MHRYSAGFSGNGSEINGYTLTNISRCGAKSIVNKTLIVSILVGGIWGSSTSPLIKSVAAETLPVVQPAAEKINSAKLQLLDAGAEPRRELKFRPAANTKQTMTMTMGMSMEMMMGESPLPKTPIPKVVMKIDLAVGKIEPSGDINYTFSYGDIKAIGDRDTPPEMLAAMQKSLKNLIGMTGNVVISSTGQVKSQNLVLPKTMDPLMKQTLTQLNKSLEQISARLPSEQVGLGAKWQTTNSLQMSGIQLNQSSTYEIVEINDRGMTIKTKINQSSPQQDLAIPGAPKAVKARINSLTANGEGRYVVLFDSLLPISGQLSTTTNSNMSIQNNSQESPTNVTSKVGVDLNITGK